MNEILYLICIALGSVLALFVIAKILGKRQVAQLEFADYVVGISIGSIAAEMATDVGDKPFYYYLIAMVIYVMIDVLLNLLGRASPAMKHFFKGKPLMLIYEGKIVYKNLKRSKLSVNDLISMAREQSYFDLNDIAYAVFENSGQLSIMPKGESRPAVVKDISKDIQEASLPCYVVADGKISYSTLKEINKDEKWLMKKLNLKDKKLKDIILATYEKEREKVEISFKG